MTSWGDNQQNSLTLNIQNETISENREYNATNIKIGSNVTDKKAHGDVIFDGGTINIKGKNVMKEQ